MPADRPIDGIDASKFLRGQNPASGRESILFFGPDGANAIKTEVSVSAGLDVALGVPLLVIGALVASGRLHGRRRAPEQAGHGQDPKKDEWAQRILRKPRYGLIVLIGVGCGLPGGAYLAALHTLVTGSRQPRRRSSRSLSWP